MSARRASTWREFARHLGTYLRYRLYQGIAEGAKAGARATSRHGGPIPNKPWPPAPPPPKRSRIPKAASHRWPDGIEAKASRVARSGMTAEEVATAFGLLREASRKGMITVEDLGKVADLFPPAEFTKEHASELLIHGERVTVITPQDLDETKPPTREEA